MKQMTVEVNAIAGIGQVYKITPEQLEKVRVRGIPPGSVFAIETAADLTMLPVDGDGRAIANGQDVTGPLMELVARNTAQLWAPINSLKPERWQELDELEKAKLLGFTVIRNPANGMVSLTKETKTMGIVTVSYELKKMPDGKPLWNVFAWDNPFGGRYVSQNAIGVDRKIRRTDNWAINEGSKLLHEQREKANAPIPENQDDAMRAMGWEIEYYSEQAGPKYQGLVCYYTKLIGTKIVRIHGNRYGNKVAWHLQHGSDDYYATPMEVVKAMDANTETKEVPVYKSKATGTPTQLNNYPYKMQGFSVRYGREGYDVTPLNAQLRKEYVEALIKQIERYLGDRRAGGKTDTMRTNMD